MLFLSFIFDSKAEEQNSPTWLLWDGESELQRHSSNYFFSEIIEEGEGYIFRGKPDPWHTPGVRLSGQSWRLDFSNFDYLSFQVKAENLEMEHYVSVSGWFIGQSNKVKIRDYMDEGLLDETWRTVKIPISAFINETCDLSSVEFLSFSKGKVDQRLLVDNIKLGMNTENTSPFSELEGKFSIALPEYKGVDQLFILNNKWLVVAVDPFPDVISELDRLSDGGYQRWID
ncbi:MAG: hypothetical protein NE330_03045, partial [Lentisphaeraceae bacterium]|nr:hypothetical protein [Lentisphaeraceae bacterium]